MAPSPRGEAAGAEAASPRPDTAACLTGADDSFGLGGPSVACGSVELPAGADLGGVTILRLLDHGGMGRVYEARQDAPRRTVAVKVLRAGAVTDADVERLLHEAETLARLRHPHIAQIHTFGRAPAALGGVPFFVMELVEDARPITRFAASRSLSLRSRVALFHKVCHAVAHGHRHGVIHRDLKPANILVDKSGEPKVIDYGIAGAAPVAGTAPAEAPETPASGDVVGTLRYMSPEQVLAPERGPDTRSDVYALGLVLHELVTGRLPFDLAGKSFAEAVRLLGSAAAPGLAVVEREALAEERRDDARALAVIVATCLEPAAADRYVDAGAVADDLARWLDGRAIMARPPTPLESVRRLARRHRVAVTAAAGLVATLVAAVLAVSLLSVRLEGQRRLARAAEVRAATEADDARRQLYASTVLLATAARDRDNLAEAGHLLDKARMLAEPGDAEPVELACLAGSLDDAIDMLRDSDDEVTTVAWSPDGTVVAEGNRRGVVRVRAAVGATCGPPRTLDVRDGPVWAVAFAPTGRLMAAAFGTGDVGIYDVASGESIRLLDGGRTPIYAVEFSPDGERIATAARDRTARIWKVRTGRELAVLRGHEGTVYGVAFSPDGGFVATASHDGSLRVWDAQTGRQRGDLQGHTDRVFDVAVAPDGRTLASASEDGSVRLWDVVLGTETGCLRHPARVNAVAFSTAGDRVATASADGILRTWDVRRAAETAHLRGHRGGIMSVAWSPDDARLATGSADGTVRIWSAEGRPDVLHAAGRVLSAAYSPDGRTLAAGVEHAEVRLWDARTLEDRGALGPAMGRVHGVAWSPRGDLVAAACDDGTLFVWDAQTRERIVAAQVHAKRVYAVAFSPDGTRVATASEDRTVAVRDPRTNGVAGPTLQHPRRVFCAAFAPGESRIATACEDRAVRLWDSLTGEERRRLVGHGGPVNWVAYSPDGQRLASSSSDGTVRIWRLADGAVEHVLAGPASQVWKVAYSGDGSRIAGAAADGTVHLWDAATGRPALALRGHGDQVWAVAFAPDGRSLASGSWDGTARMWGLAPAMVMRNRAAAGPPTKAGGF